MARRQLWTDRPQHRARAVAPAHRADTIVRDPGLLCEPVSCGKNIRHPLAASVNVAFLDVTLRAEFARAIAVRKQDRLAVLQQLLCPIPIARLYGLGTAGQAAAPMQRNHDRKRTIAIGLEKYSMQQAALEGNLHLIRYGQWSGICRTRHGKGCQQDYGGPKAHEICRVVMLLSKTAIHSIETITRKIPISSQIGGFNRRTPEPICGNFIGRHRPAHWPEPAENFSRAEQIRPLRPWRGKAAISRRRLPRGIAWNLCALRGHRCAHSAR